jgi:hypothetical protein
MCLHSGRDSCRRLSPSTTICNEPWWVLEVPSEHNSLHEQSLYYNRSLALCLGVGFVAGTVTTPEIPAWCASLEKLRSTE